MKKLYKGCNRVTKRLANGKTVTYWYAWKGGPRIHAEPGTPAFAETVKRLQAYPRRDAEPCTKPDKRLNPSTTTIAEVLSMYRTLVVNDNTGKPEASPPIVPPVGKWQELRYRALKLHGAKCQCCGAAGGQDGKKLHVDHIKPQSIFPELQWELSNLQVLCEDCNIGKGAWDQTDWRLNHVTEIGNS